MQFSQEWLQKVVGYDSRYAKARGEITRIEELGNEKVAYVKWDQPGVPSSARMKYLVHEEI